VERRQNMLGINKKGGERGKRGSYWNFTTGERLRLEEEGPLPGDKSVMYLKVPPVAILLAGPVLGLLYAVFLPFIGIAMLVQLVAKKAVAGVMAKAGSSAAFTWSPVRAYLTGKKRKEGKGTEDKKEPEGEDPGDQ